MCGIAGVVFKSKATIDVGSEISVISKLIKHRGPDGEGFLGVDFKGIAKTFYGINTTENVKESNLNFCPKQNISELNSQECKFVFAHRRLAIIDVEASGHQPMCDVEQNYWITYNGEIYNYIELKKELIDLGHKFITHSDTEVLIEAYKEWGTNCVAKFNGMWAFVLYDKKQNILFGSRDRLGVKPFYYYSDNAVFCFASEQKALVKSSIVKPELRQEAAFDYFILNQIEYEEEGMFAKVFELFPAHSFVFNLLSNEFRKWNYYKLPTEINNTEINFEEKFKQLFFKSIELRLRSDVKVGSCLSGGLDSSSIVAAMNSLQSNDSVLELFTASYNDQSIDESRFAKQIVDSTHSNWHQVFPTAEQLQNDFSDMIYSLDVPIWSTSTFAQYSVMRLANENNIKVLLDGQGGDELLAGYPHHYYHYWNELFSSKKFNLLRSEINNTPTFLASKTGFVGFKTTNKLKAIKKIAENYYLKKNSNNVFLSKDFIESYKHRIGLKLEKNQDLNLNQQLRKELINTTLKTYLRCEDRCSMRFSVESRTPFADDLPLIEFLIKLPSSKKIKNGENKWILRKSMQSFLPKEIAARKDKKGYLTPNNNWLKQLKPFFTEELQTSNTKLFNSEKLIRSYSNELDQKQEGNLFKYISFSNWHKQYFVK